MGVEVVDGEPDAEQALELGRELATEVVGVDAPGRETRQELPPREREAPRAVDERRDLPRAEQRRVLTHRREMRPDAEVRCSAGHRPCVEPGRERQHRGGRDDAVA